MFCCTTDIHVRRDAFLNRCGAERQSLPHSPRTARVSRVGVARPNFDGHGCPSYECGVRHASRCPDRQSRPRQLVLAHKTPAWRARYHELHECEEAVFCCTTDIHVRRDAFLNRCGAERQSLPHSPRTERVRAWELLNQTSTDMDVRRTSVAPGTRAVALTVKAVLHN